jgi:transposase
MLYVQPLSEIEISDLEKLTQQAVGRVAERSWYILLSNKGKSVPEICEIFNRHPNCVRKWIKRYQAQGIDGLKDEQRSGRPHKVNEQTKEKIDESFKKTLKRWDF